MLPTSSRFARAFLACALLLGAAGAQTRPPSPLDRVRSLVAAHKLDAAEAELWKIVRANPDDAAALALMGTIRTEQGRFDEADALLLRAVTLQPSLADAHFQRGELLEKRGKLADAVSSYQEAHKLSPKNVKISVRLATVLESSGDYQGSLDAAESIPVAQRPSLLLPVLASDYLALHQTAKLTPIAGRVLAAASSDPAIGLRFAKVLLQYGLVPDAEELLKRLPEAQKTTSDYLVLRARVEEMSGRVPEARRTLAAAVERDPRSFDALYQSARLASSNSDWGQEAALLQRALEISPENTDCLRQLIAAQMRMHQVLPAIRSARRLLQLQPDNSDAMYLLAAASIEGEQWSTARPLLEKLIGRRDTAPDRVALGMVLFSLGEFDAAAVHIDRALELDPKESEAHYYKALLARQRGDSALAISELETVVAAHPDHARALGALGKLYLQAGQADRARDALEKAVKLAPDAGDNHYQLALAYSRLGMAEPARAEMATYNRLKEAVDSAKRATAPSATPQ